MTPGAPPFFPPSHLIQGSRTAELPTKNPLDAGMNYSSWSIGALSADCPSRSPGMPVAYLAATAGLISIVRCPVLVLSRKVGEMIQIGDDIVLTVVSVEGNKVRIGIKAPATTPILRGELVVRDAQGARIAMNSGTTRG